MNDSKRSLRFSRVSRAVSTVAFALGIAACAVHVDVTAAATRGPVAARSGLEAALAGARAWAPDAELVYIENDEALDDRGTAPRWGYLFHSTSLGRSRVYSVREGRILVAENLDMKFTAPPLAGPWIDSSAALQSADNGPGLAFRRDHGGRLDTMLLMRGAFRDDDPDATNWTLVYAAASGPSLFVVVDAVDGKVRRTWRG